MSATKILLAASCGACLLFFAGCAPSPLKGIEPRYHSVVEKLYKMPWDERKTALESSDLETQYAWCLYMTHKSHPIPAHYARALAEHGKKIIPLLCEKISSTDDYGTVKLIVTVFYSMFMDGYYYQVIENEEVMRLLADSVQRANIQSNDIPAMMLRQMQLGPSRM